MVSDTYRTLLNKMVAFAAATNMAFVTVVFPVITVRHLHYPLPDYLCSTHIFLTVALLAQEFLIQNEFAILLFLCSRRPYLVGTMNESLMKTFLLSLSLILSIYFSTIITVFFGSDHVVYRSCVGQYSCMLYIILMSVKISHKMFLLLVDDNNSENYMLVLALLTLFNHIIFSYIHHRGKMKIQPQIHVNGAQIVHPYHDFVETSLIDHNTLVGIFVFVFVCGPVIASFGYLIQRDFGFLVAVRVMIVYTFLLFLPLSLYFRKKHLRITLWKQFKSLC